MPKIRPLLMGGVAVLLALVVACGGDSDDSNSSADPTSTANGGTTVGSDNNSSGSGNTLQSINLNESAARLSELTSFRFDMAISLEFGDASADDPEAELAAAMLAAFGNISAEGAFIAPDRMAVTATLLGQEVSTIQIGDKAWEKTDDTWEETTADAGMFSFGDPSEMFTDFLPDDLLDVADTSQEKVNGVDTVHYSFDKESLEAAATSMGEASGEFAELSEANLDLWLTEDGVPVKIVMDFTGSDESGAEMSIQMEMNISDINSDSIEIEAPI